jgi:hypothetical protein
MNSAKGEVVVCFKVLLLCVVSTTLSQLMRLNDGEHPKESISRGCVARYATGVISDRANAGVISDRANAGVITDRVNGGVITDRVHAGVITDRVIAGVITDRVHTGVITDRVNGRDGVAALPYPSMSRLALRHSHDAF